jgi:hypothetical protein
MAIPHQHSFKMPITTTKLSRNENESTPQAAGPTRMREPISNNVGSAVEFEKISGGSGRRQAPERKRRNGQPVGRLRLKNGEGITER